jgi:hypothetical protein
LSVYGGQTALLPSKEGVACAELLVLDRPHESTHHEGAGKVKEDIEEG